MGEHTAIEWSDGTWNPAWGCNKVSRGCTNCYAERLMERWGLPFTVVRETKWRGKPKQDPRLWKEPKRIFTLSMGDFFHPTCDQWRDEWWEVIRSCPQHTFLILTKRPEWIAEHLPQTCFTCGVHEWAQPIGAEPHALRGWPWPNVWLGTSVENQKYAEIRIPQLVAVPAVVHFLSCEPLLGPIDFSRRLGDWMVEFATGVRVNADAVYLGSLLRDIEWIIAGGESDPHPRPTDPAWFRSIRHQCAVAGVPFFFKQTGGNRHGTCGHPECRSTWGCGMLDGKVHHEFPRKIT